MESFSPALQVRSGCLPERLLHGALRGQCAMCLEQQKYCHLCLWQRYIPAAYISLRGWCSAMCCWLYSCSAKRSTRSCFVAGFAIALAIPFTLFAIFPSMLKELPRSGGWLNSVKVVLGFLELALALKFLSVADLCEGWGILDREVFLVLWIVIFALLGMYLLGKLKFSHDSDIDYVSIPRFFLALASFSFAMYLIPGLCC